MGFINGFTDEVISCRARLWRKIAGGRRNHLRDLLRIPPERYRQRKRPTCFIGAGGSERLRETRPGHFAKSASFSSLVAA